MSYDSEKPPNKACTGRLGLGAFLELVLNYGSFRFRALFSPAAGNASRWAAELCRDKSKGKVSIVAPRFTTLMYQVYASDNRVDALICFPVAQGDSIFPFRDKLADALLKIGDIQIQRTQGYPLPPDSIFRFYSEKYSISFEQFLQKKRPSFLSRLMNSAEWISYRKEERSAAELIDAEIETSHDFPCIVIHSHIHSEETLSELIKEAARELAIEISRNIQLGPIQEVLTSNESFDL